MHNEVLRSRTLAAAHSCTEVSATRNPVRLGKHVRGVTGSERQPNRLRGELGASLAAARSQNGATRTGAHTKAEAVHLGTLAVVRLERSLAHSDNSKAQLYRAG
jgi:hypothetical protein